MLKHISYSLPLDTESETPEVPVKVPRGSQILAFWDDSHHGPGFHLVLLGDSAQPLEEITLVFFSPTSIFPEQKSHHYEYLGDTCVDGQRYLVWKRSKVDPFASQLAGREAGTQSIPRR